MHVPETGGTTGRLGSGEINMKIETLILEREKKALEHYKHTFAHPYNVLTIFLISAYNKSS